MLAVEERPCIGVISMESGVGKTLFTHSLGAVLAGTGKDVILIDLNFMGGGQYNRLGCANQSGATDYLAEEIDISLSPGIPEQNQQLIQRILRPTRFPGLKIIPRGVQKSGQEDLYKSENMKHLVLGAKSVSEAVIVDLSSVAAAGNDIYTAVNSCSIAAIICKRGMSSASGVSRIYRAVSGLSVHSFVFINQV